MGSSVGDHCGWLNHVHVLLLELQNGEEVYRAERVELVTYLYQKLHLIPLDIINNNIEH